MDSYLDRYKGLEKLNDPDPYGEIFNKCAEALCLLYSDQLHQFIKTNLPHLEEEINDIEKRIEEMWDIAHLILFREELINFYKMHRRAKNILDYFLSRVD